MTIENLAERCRATAAEFDQNSIDESKGSERAILIGLINPVVGWPALEFVIHQQLRCAEERLYFVYPHANPYLSLVARDTLGIGLPVRRFGRQRQRETENVRRKVSADLLARHAAPDKEHADVGLPGARGKSYAPASCLSCRGADRTWGLPISSAPSCGPSLAILVGCTQAAWVRRYRQGQVGHRIPVRCG